LPQTLAPSARTPDAVSCDGASLPCCPEPQSPAQVSECALFRGLYALDTLARLPVPEYSSHMVSSFDPRSRSAAPSTPDWFANRDFLELAPDATHVLFDEAGPGVITRIWSANPSGRVQVYLDDEPEPAIDAELSELLQGRVGVQSAAFAFKVGGGSNLYLPVPYQRRCRIALQGAGRRLFYQINFQRYAPDVQLPRFDLNAHAHPHGAAAQAGQALRAQAELAIAPAWRKRTETLHTGSSAAALLAADGGSVLRLLRVRPNTSDPLALRQTALSISVDGERTVHVPLADFFGAGPEPAEVRALPVWTELAPLRFTSRWPMPFQRELRVALVRAAGEAEVSAELELWSEPQRFDTRSLLFFARAASTGPQPNEPTHDYTLAEIHGDGVYVGTRLNVTNSEAAWWGEGDEKIWLDGEAFPSLFGTGTEDYFGYAYCSNETFARAYIGQPSAGARGNYGRVALYRFHAPDPIRFRSSLRFDLEVNHWGKSGKPVAHDGIVYFYARPGARVTTMDAAPWSIPELPHDGPPPDVAEGPYRCGG